ncbi:MAG: ion transporter [Candidatus Marinimicrobia bacterium]|nr:ion transporter [Candidatus Neomarinimicrobiota bacterium]
MLATVPSMALAYGRFFKLFELFSITIFSVEYLLRVWTCTENERYSGSIMGRLRYILTPMALIDLVAILPFYLPLIMPVDLRFLRALRILRIFRLLKFARYSRAVRIFGRVIHEKKEELVISLSAILVALVLIASLMYYLEKDIQPEAFGSIPAALWWGVVSLTTVGYGDVYPITPLGKIFGGMVALLGIGVFALPAGIIASGFAQATQAEETLEAGEICPHCGQRIDH